MKFSLTVEYTEKEYIESTSAWSGLVRTLLENMPNRGTVSTRVETQEEVVKEAATIPFTRPLGPVEVEPHELLTQAQRSSVSFMKLKEIAHPRMFPSGRSSVPICQCNCRTDRSRASCPGGR